MTIIRQNHPQTSTLLAVPLAVNTHQTLEEPLLEEILQLAGVMYQVLAEELQSVEDMSQVLAGKLRPVAVMFQVLAEELQSVEDMFQVLAEESRLEATLLVEALRQVVIHLAEAIRREDTLLVEAPRQGVILQLVAQRRQEAIRRLVAEFQIAHKTVQAMFQLFQESKMEIHHQIQEAVDTLLTHQVEAAKCRKHQTPLVNLEEEATCQFHKRLMITPLPKLQTIHMFRTNSLLVLQPITLTLQTHHHQAILPTNTHRQVRYKNNTSQHHHRHQVPTFTKSHKSSI